MKNRMAEYRGFFDQDRTYAINERKKFMNSCIERSLKSFQYEYIRIIENCKKVLIKYDMLEEFKQNNELFSHYFDLKENDITKEMISYIQLQLNNSLSNLIDLDGFIVEIIKCVQSQEMHDKKYKKYELIKKKKKKKEELELNYKKEFECVKILNAIEEKKMNSEELYIEYKKIIELKNKYRLDGVINTMFLDYFTNEKKIYLNNLLEK